MRFLAGLALGLLVGLVVLGLAWCLMGCGPAPEARTADVVGSMVDQAGAELAAWSVAHTDCAGLTPADCEARVREEHAPLWTAWDAYAAAWDLYAAALEHGGDPSRADLEAAGCRVVAALPEDAPAGLRALCPGGSR